MSTNLIYFLIILIKMNSRYVKFSAEIIILNDRNFNSRYKNKQFKCIIYELKRKTNWS